MKLYMLLALLSALSVATVFGHGIKSESGSITQPPTAKDFACGHRHLTSTDLKNISQAQRYESGGRQLSQYVSVHKATDTVPIRFKVSQVVAQYRVASLRTQ